MKNEPVTMNGSDQPAEDEARLIEAARYDPVEFSKLYHRYVVPVYRYLYKWVDNSAEAEDLTSQVFTEVLEGLAHYREQGHFAAWLFTISRRKAIAAYRRQPQAVLPLEEADEVAGTADDPLERVIWQEEQEKMAALFAGLNENQRDLLRLRYSACLSYSEIGELLGQSEAAAKMAIHRLLQRMNTKWEEK